MPFVLVADLPRYGFSEAFVQLIPRYAFEKRGSRNFVKERKAYTEDPSKIDEIRELLRSKRG